MSTPRHAGMLVAVMRLALRDFVHEARISICLVLACAAVLGPLLVLFGLKSGLIDTMTQELVEDPRNREILPRWSALFPPDWFAQVRSRPDVAFLIPRTRYTATEIRLRKADTADATSFDFELVPSAAGDPLLGDRVPVPRGYDSVVLTEGAARKLAVDVGAEVEALVARTNDTTAASRHLAVAGILPETAYSRDAAFASLALLIAVENYRDDIAVPEIGWSGSHAPDTATDRRFPGFRLYARSVTDVPPLRDFLETSVAEARVELITHADEIERLQRLERDLSFVFWILAATGAGGYLTALAATMWATVGRKQRELGVLHLIGFSRRGLMLFPMTQSWITGLLGSVVALAFFTVSSAFVNRHFAASLGAGERICRLRPIHVALAIGLTLASTAMAALLAGRRAYALDVSEGLRDE